MDFKRSGYTTTVPETYITAYWTFLRVLQLTGFSRKITDVATIEAGVNALYRPEVTVREISALDVHISEMYSCIQHTSWRDESGMYRTAKISGNV